MFLHKLSCCAIANSAMHPKMKKTVLFLLFFLLSTFSIYSQNADTRIAGTVTDSSGAALPGVTVTEKGTNNTVTTGAEGAFAINVKSIGAILVFSAVGYTTQEEEIKTNAAISIVLQTERKNLDEVIVIGYGTRRRESVTQAISTVTAKDIEKVHAGATVSTTLAGKLPGVSFRQAEGRPGASAGIQIRNFGPALYVIDGVQLDESAFNNLSPGDIESISVLKDASAAIYGLRASNGVVVVTTKKGKLGEKPSVSIDAFYGIQNWTRFPEVLDNSYDYMRYRAEAEINWFGSTAITPAELEKYKQGTAYGYQSFNWRDFIIKKNSPLTSATVSASGGSDKITYYLSASHLYQNSVLGREFKFNRSNVLSNVSAKLANGLKVGVGVDGRMETTKNPGVPGVDDYFNARFSILRNTPLERPYANDNPLYLNDIKHNETNWAYLNYDKSGTYELDWRRMRVNLTADYQLPFVKGLTISGLYSTYFESEVLNNHEYTYITYTYDPATDKYTPTGGSTNPWREREQIKQVTNLTNIKLNYNRVFGQHTLEATLVNERISFERTRNWIHSVPPLNTLQLIYFSQSDTYQDSDDKTARLGYVARVSYGFAGKYNIDLSGRRDASYIFPPDKRVGYFPSASAGWRISREAFMKNMVGTVLTDLKLRASYGILGKDLNDDNSSIVAPFRYLSGYNYNVGSSIFNGQFVPGARDQGIPITNITWVKSKLLDIGLDYSFLNNKITGSIDYFKRKRTGLLAPKNDVVIPAELGYTLPLENLNSDQQAGIEGSVLYTGTLRREIQFTIGGNVSYSRAKTLETYKPVFNNSWDQYRNGTTDRYANLFWGYEVTGQFQSQDEINNYMVNIDGKGNSTLLPGDLIYKDQNGDGKIDGYDQRPIGYNAYQPLLNYGLSLGFNYRQFDFSADFSGAAGYTWVQNWETRWAFQNGGNFNTIFEDRWHREDPYDSKSPWIPGKYPANRFNPGTNHSNYNAASTFWTHNVKYLRARTIELGYTLPKRWTSSVKATRARVYVNAYNLFSIDNLKQYNVDPEVSDDNGLQVPQSKVINFGFNLSF